MQSIIGKSGKAYKRTRRGKRELEKKGNLVQVRRIEYNR